jgi:hypothetical protein
MKLPIFLLAAVALSTGVAVAADMAPTKVSNTVICRWRATQQSGIPVQICLTRKQWAMRTAYTQQTIREFQQRSFVHR